MALPADYLDNVRKALGEKGVIGVCDGCGKNNWSIVSQPIKLPLTDLTTNVRIPEPNIPCAAVVCSTCGNVRLHALGVLGLLPGIPTKDGGKG
jgi:hypothetical protein